VNYDKYKDAYNALNLSGDRLLKGALSLGTEYREFKREPNISEAGDVLCAIMLIDSHYALNINPCEIKSIDSQPNEFLVLDIQELIKKIECKKEDYIILALRSVLYDFTRRFIIQCMDIAPLSEIFEYNINKLKSRC
jgi:hypothetical protein